MIKLYGHYISQPMRSLTWLMKMHALPFEFIKINPVEGDTKKPEFTAKFPTALSPGLDDNGFYLAEGSAICQYLCEKHSWEQWWPSGRDTASIQKRAKISEYLSSHHHTSRLVSAKAFRPFMVGIFTKKPWTAEVVGEHQVSVLKIAAKFERAFLERGPGPFVNGMAEPSIADLIAYPEFAQMRQCGLVDYSGLPRMSGWLDRIQALPMHDDVHRTLFKLAPMGGFVKPSDGK